MLSTMRGIPRPSRLTIRASQKRLFAAMTSSPPLMWKLAHGMFDPETSMLEKFPGVPDPVEIAPPTASKVQITTLENGVRVASQDLGGPVSALGLFVGAGSRNETPYSAGISHALERLAYKGSTKRSKYRMIRDMERTGALYSASSSRETIAYCAEGLREQTADMVGIMAESAFSPTVAVEDAESPEWDMAVDEIKVQTGAMKAQLEDFKNDAAGRVTEAIHAAAFHGNTLGLPLVSEERKLAQLTPAVVSSFVKENFTADNVVLSGANVNHEALVSMASTAFDSLPTSGVGSLPAKYTGGSVTVTADGPAHIAIGFQGVSWQDDDLVPACVLHTLLGGGGSFSSGGPGKGMYTRLYAEILNRHGWVSSAMAFNHCYADTGIFGIHASCDDPANLNNLIEVVSGQMGKLMEPLASGELDRAKAMTKSSLIMNLESRGVVCEDLGRQVLSSGRYVTPEELVKRIQAVTESDLLALAARMLKSQPSVVQYGEEYATYEYKSIESSIKAKAKIAS